MPLQATSGAASYDAFGGGVPVVPAYIEDVFSTYLYTGNGSTQTITNGIDLSTKGGMTWIKQRSATRDNLLFDTNRGATQRLFSNLTLAQSQDTQSLTAFNTNGFSIGSDSGCNINAGTYASWTFRKQPKFFDVVTYTGNGTQGRSVSHNLGSVPGFIIVKRTDGVDNWRTYHRSLGGTKFMSLDTTAAAGTANTIWNNADPTSTVFYLGNDASVNGNGMSYVAYLFAHDAGGFGLTGTDNVISCGNYTGNSSTQTITLGYEPQFLLIKKRSSTDDWKIFDNMRGMPVAGSSKFVLSPNLSAAEDSFTDAATPIATGFQVNGGGVNDGSDIYIYIAIRRGPMKVPTVGTSVFETGFDSATLEDPTIRLSNLSYVDTAFAMRRTSPDSDWPEVGSRLTQGEYLRSSSTAAKVASVGKWRFNFQNGFGGSAWDNDTVAWCFKRAPSFHDVVCYSGDSTLGREIPHNLAAVPELMIVKNRNFAENWVTYSAPTGNTTRMILNSPNASGTRAVWANTTPTSTNFYVGGSGVLGETNASGSIYVAYLFATLAGVSKVGSYTGTGTTLQINCGFTAGARFVLIKRTNSTGDWYVWDTARGIVSGNDPYLLLNTEDAEVTSTDYVDTYSAGFELSSTAPAAINASGGTFIFLAIA